MCWSIHKTRARFPDCTEKSLKNCLNYDPAEDAILWCILAEQRGHLCPQIIPTSQGASTKRRMNCPRHRKRLPAGPAQAQPGMRKKYKFGFAKGGGGLVWRFPWSWGKAGLDVRHGSIGEEGTGDDVSLKSLECLGVFGLLPLLKLLKQSRGIREKQDELISLKPYAAL
ncbi:hypothetical protein BJY01DRAFT_252251 [Aspergillus pseudoustus]|uniref:Uncharacterized protein n=1 Tax=Aspergillus pseudoustus TaxID=1810923 RepID=A0ABR4J843_9EURO